MLEAGGVGYLVFMTDLELASLKTGQEVLLRTYLVVKEDALDLYGSFEPKIIAWFKLLLTVKGIGPKSALAIMGKAAPKDLSGAITHQASDILTGLGINKKLAERVVLELKNRVSALADGEVGSAQAVSMESEALQALESLGYFREQARDALKQAEGEDVQSKVRSALRILGRR